MSARVIECLDKDVYHADPAIGSTTLKYAHESMAKFKAKIDGKIKGSDRSYFDIGTACHAGILERDFAGYIRGPDAAKNTKEWKDFAAETRKANRVPLTATEYDRVKAVYGAFQRHPLASKVLSGGKAEVSYFAEFFGHPYKARADFIREIDGALTIVDYKTTAQGSDSDSFAWSIINLGYDISAGHYCNVIEAATGLSVDNWIWIAQDVDSEPHELMIHDFDSAQLDSSKALCAELYERIANCHKTGIWPGRYPTDIQHMSLSSIQLRKGNRL